MQSTTQTTTCANEGSLVLHLREKDKQLGTTEGDSVVQKMKDTDKITELNNKMSDQNSSTTVGTTIAASVGLGCFIGYGAYFKILTVSAATGTSTVLGPCLLIGGVVIAVGVNQALKADLLITEMDSAL